MKGLKATLVGALLTLGAPSNAYNEPQPTLTVIRTVVEVRGALPGYVSLFKNGIALQSTNNEAVSVPKLLQSSLRILDKSELIRLP